MKLRCNKILVTGGGSGIGFAIAKRLIGSGAKVVITGRTLEKLENAKEKIDSENLSIMQWDASALSVCLNNINKAASMMGGLDGLVNNAAISPEFAGRGYEPWDVTEEEWDMLTDTNLKAAFFMMRNTVDFMLENKVKGNILNISSNAACMNIAGPYGISKLSLLAMTRTFGKKFGNKGIIINGIAPGATFTSMISSYAKNIDDKYERHAIGRFIHPDEIAELAAYLMSDYGEIICGHTVVADGGDGAAI